MAWGALSGGDYSYDINLNKVGNDKPVYDYGTLLYRQTLPDPAWTQWMTYVGANSRAASGKRQRESTGAAGGYCTAANFELYGAGCIGP
jgi:hypothetical protein